MNKIALPLAACLLAIAAVGAHAQTLWKWRDASGQLHISDKAPPPGTPAKNIISAPPGGIVAPPALAPAAAAPKADAAASAGGDSSLDKKKKAADQERLDKEKADRAAVDTKNNAIRADNCSRAKAALAGIQGGQRLGKINANGEREMLDDAGRAAEEKRTQDIIAANCGAAPAQ